MEKFSMFFIRLFFQVKIKKHVFRDHNYFTVIKNDCLIILIALRRSLQKPKINQLFICKILVSTFQSKVRVYLYSNNSMKS